MLCRNCNRENNRGEVCDECAAHFQSEMYDEVVEDAEKAMRRFRYHLDVASDIDDIVKKHLEGA